MGQPMARDRILCLPLQRLVFQILSLFGILKIIPILEEHPIKDVSDLGKKNPKSTLMESVQTVYGL